MKKVFAAACCTVFFGMASPVLAGMYYESYDGYQYVSEGDYFSFFFDLEYKNKKPYTDSSLKLNDAKSGDKQYDSVFVDIDLYSKDWVQEKVKITLEVYEDGITYSLFNDWFSGGSDNIKNFHFDLTGTGLVDEPWGFLTITASSTSWMHDNDFAITKVAMGGTTAPVPEPATMLLFGAGLVGLAAAGRKRS